MPVNAKKPLCVFDPYSATVFWLHAHQTVLLNSLESPNAQKTVVRIWYLLCNGFWINLVLRATIQTHQKLNQRQKTAVSG
jgi:hypothetical protein